MVVLHQGYPSLWNGLRPVIDQADSAKQTLKSITYFMKEKAALDAYYSKQLKKL